MGVERYGPLLVVMMSAAFGTFGNWRQAIEIAFVVVAFIAGIAETRTGKLRLDAVAFRLIGAKARELVALIDTAKGFRNVVQFRDDGMLHFAESHDQPNDQKRRRSAPIPWKR